MEAVGKGNVNLEGNVYSSDLLGGLKVLGYGAGGAAALLDGYTTYQGCSSDGSSHNCPARGFMHGLTDLVSLVVADKAADVACGDPADVLCVIVVAAVVVSANSATNAGEDQLGDWTKMW
jgi:hypothetical protein